MEALVREEPGESLNEKSMMKDLPAEVKSRMILRKLREDGVHLDFVGKMFVTAMREYYSQTVFDVSDKVYMTGRMKTLLKVQEEAMRRIRREFKQLVNADEVE